MSNEKILFYVDDDRDLKRFVDVYWKSVTDNRGGFEYFQDIDQFIEKYKTVLNKKDKLESYFLLDSRMPVPSFLGEDKNVWGTYRNRRADVCGLALAGFLIKECNIRKNNIKVISAFYNIVANELDNFKNLEGILSKKSYITESFMKNWLNEAKGG